MPAYYSEFDPQAAAWLRELIRAGHLPPGDVDERDIRDVVPADLAGYRQCHFFAGIGGWPHALRLAGWPDDRPVWTGSCPCQPYSTAGKGLGDKDPRNLWPDFFRLVRQCRPDVCFGEQVEGAVRHGWLDRVCADLEGEGYAVGAVVLGAHSVGAPHIRQRLYWVADAQVPGGRADAGAVRVGSSAGLRGEEGQNGRRSGIGSRRAGDSGATGRPLAHSVGGGVRGPGRGADGGAAAGVQGADGERERVRADAGAGGAGVALGVEHPESHGREQRRAGADGRGVAGGCGVGRLVGVAQGDANQPGPQGRGVSDGERAGERAVGPADGDTGFWDAYDLIPCRDGKARRVEPGTFPLVDGFPARVAVLRGFGNAIVPQVAAEFVRAWLEVTGEG